MTTADAAIRIGICKQKVAEYCAKRKIRATRIAKGRLQSQWDIPEDALADFLRTKKSNSEVRKQQWATRRRIAQPMPADAVHMPSDPHRLISIGGGSSQDGPLPDDVHREIVYRTQDLYPRAKTGDPAAHHTLRTIYRLSLWERFDVGKIL